jgi:ATP-dependent helicase/nuclease subunit A
MLTDKKRKVRYTTLARTAIQSKLSDEMLSEELRVLYVAMTRAREKLIITAALRNTERTMEKITLIPEGIVAPQTILSLRSMIEWILVGVRGIDENELSINYINTNAFEGNLESASITGSRTVSLSVSKHTDEAISNVCSIYATGEDPDHIFTYPYKLAVDLPSKLTVTGLKTLLDPEAEIAPWVRNAGKEKSFYLSPSFITGENEMTAADRGILLHLVMQHIDYKMCSNEHDEECITKELQRLNNIGIITDKQADEVDVHKIMKFLSSSLGGRMISSRKLEKEFKFSILRPAEDYFPNSGTDKILLQGVIDCFFEEDGEIVVVDFKTDRVTEKTVTEAAHHYSRQLNAYADALHHITGKRVKERIIYFFSLDRAYSLE